MKASAALLVLLLPALAAAQPSSGVLDHTVPPGASYDKAESRERRARGRRW